jgi:hypothetical protein
MVSLLTGVAVMGRWAHRAIAGYVRLDMGYFV